MKLHSPIVAAKLGICLVPVLLASFVFGALGHVSAKHTSESNISAGFSSLGDRNDTRDVSALHLPGFQHNPVETSTSELEALKSEDRNEETEFGALFRISIGILPCLNFLCIDHSEAFEVWTAETWSSGTPRGPPYARS